MRLGRLHWLTIGLLAACASSGPVQPSDPPPPSVPAARELRIAELRAELASPEERRKAWAAWNAGEEGLAELVPELLHELEIQSARPSDWEWPACASALLDALIRLEARVPAGSLAPFVGSSSRCQQIPACILAAREPSAHIEALESAQRSFVPDVGFIAAHVLARGYPRLAVLRALRDAQVVVRLDVVDPGQEGEAPATKQLNPARLVIHGSPDDPPAAVYSMVREAAAGDLRLPQLPGGVGYRRTVYRERAELQVHRSFQMYGADGAALLWDLAHTDAEVPGMRLATSATTTEELEALALPALESRLAAWKAVVQSLLAQGLIEPSMTQMRAPLELRCRDLRTQPDASLINVFAPIETAWRRRLAELGECALALDSAQIEGLRRDLGSNQLDRRAWAAFAASEGGLGLLGPDLRASLASLIFCEANEPREWTLRNLLDALIRLRVPVGSAELRDWEGQEVDKELLLLAANDPPACVEFLEHCVAEPIPYKRHDQSWLAAGNLLARADPKRAAAVALGDLRVTLDVHVLDDPDQSVRGPNPNTVHGDARPMEITVIFPPFAYYTLEPVRAGEEIVGRRNPTSRGQSSFQYREHEANSYRLDILRWLAGIPDAEPALTGYVHVKQVWSMPEALQEEVRARRAALFSEWSNLLETLDAKGLLDQAARARELRVKLRVEDLRQDRSGPLPDLG